MLALARLSAAFTDARVDISQRTVPIRLLIYGPLNFPAMKIQMSSASVCCTFVRLVKGSYLDMSNSCPQSGNGNNAVRRFNGLLGFSLPSVRPQACYAPHLATTACSLTLPSDQFALGYNCIGWGVAWDGA